MPLSRSNVVRRHISDHIRRTLSTRMVAHRSDSTSPYKPVSLFDRLPVELNLEIFSHCMLPFPTFDPQEAPLLITSVCHAWRTSALNTPKLWSSFEIEVTSFPPMLDPHIQSTMQLWLARSKNYPLSVKLIHIAGRQVTAARSARFLALLIPEARRWRYVQFIIPTSSFLPLPEDFPALRFLSVQLRGLRTSGPSVNVSALKFPWHQLSSLDLRLEPNNLPTLDDWLSILSHVKRLKQCTVSADCSLDLDKDSRTVRLPFLDELRIIIQGGHSNPDYPASCFVKFLHQLSMPILRNFSVLWLVELQTNWSTSHPDFLSFLRQISSTLRIFTMSYLPVSEKELIACLTEMSKVSHLYLCFSLGGHEQDPITDLLCYALTLVSSSDDTSHAFSGPELILLPHLASLDLECNGSSFSYSNLFHMILSRWNDVAEAKAAFHRFRLLSMKPTLVEVDKNVRTLTKQGLDISVDTPK